MRQYRWFKHFDFAVMDVILSIASFLLAYFFRNGDLAGMSTPLYRTALFFIAALTLILDLTTTLLKNILKRGYLKEISMAVKLATADVVALTVYQYLMKIGVAFSRQIYLTFWAFFIALVFVFHTIWKAYLNKRLADRKNLPRLVLVSDRSDIPGLQTLRNHAKNRYTIKAAAKIGSEKTSDPPSEVDGIPVLYGEDELYEYIRVHVVDEVLLNLSDVELENRLLKELMLAGVTVHVNLDRVFDDVSNLRFDNFAGSAAITGSVRPLSPVQQFIKRCMDIVGSIVGFVICGIACVFVAPIIKLQSPGPVFFSQERVGLNGRHFKIYKFRSMYADAEARLESLKSQNKMQGLMFKMDDDPRITPIGRFIRRYSVDELPQFWNVLKGDMSLVGTRPPTVSEWEQYNLRHRARLAIKPGITGLWQVSGRSNITDFDDVVSLDIKYIQEWSVRFDIKIILKTLWVVITGKGAE